MCSSYLSFNKYAFYFHFSILWITLRRLAKRNVFTEFYMKKKTL